ncbi:NXPE family member 1-like isoform X2 [Patiria miniata]|uniref:NXPE C-terminal domain-containing protein n=1 Tax=Patiria miniata TaxID=46514 RepID=A0A914A2H6_PATMI|nr:NXPE family member 1-like isoform X2 [Patiria miniata]
MSRGRPAASACGSQQPIMVGTTRRTGFTLSLCMVYFVFLCGAVVTFMWEPFAPKVAVNLTPRPGVIKEAKRYSSKDIAILLQRFLPEKNKTNRTLPLTSALTSTYRLVDQTLRVGDTAHFVIQAKDSDGRNKTIGGDFWFTVLTSVEDDHPTAGGRTAGSVVDHNNGTYSVSFYVGWPGIAYVHMTLAAPSEATKWLREQYWPVEKRIFWRGTFRNKTKPGQKPLSHSTLCYLMRNASSTDDCVADHNPNATGLTALYCERPKAPLTCDDLHSLALDVKATGQRTSQIVGKASKLFVGVNFMRRLVHGPISVKIALSPNRTESRAPVCKPDSRHLVNDGFWLNKTWHHLQCQVYKWDDTKAVGECLRHKHVYIIADSTVRSWYHEITRKLGLPWQRLGSRVVKNNYYEELDLNMTYRFHPRVITQARVTLSMTPYEVDVLFNLPTKDCGRSIFVFSSWAHFTQWTRDSYVERALLLRDAILRFRERCPDVPIVMKGAHPREHKGTQMRVVGSDYTLWALGRTLRAIFHGTGVYFFDMWQMNVAYGPSNIHMPTDVISEEVNWFLTYVCGFKNSTT